VIKTLIVDDEKLARDLLIELINKDNELALIGQCNDGQQALDCIRRLQPGLVFLDIQMPIMDGLAVVKNLQEMVEPPYIIFVTAFDQYAIQAFDYHVLDYVVKPIDKSRLYMSIKRAKVAIEQKSLAVMAQRMSDMVKTMEKRTIESQTLSSAPHHLVINTGYELVSIKPQEIIWVEAANQYVKIHMLNERHIMSENLSQFSQRLDMKGFLRVHRSALINLCHLKRVSKKSNGTHLLTLRGDIQVVLSRGKADLLPLLLEAVCQSQ
jgi:two-component system LytT family response regulator